MQRRQGLEGGCQSRLLFDDRFFRGRTYRFLPWRLLLAPGRARKNSDGTHVETEVTLTTFKLGNAHYTQSIIRDVTHRKKIEETLVDLNKTLEDRVAQRTGAKTHRPVAARQSSAGGSRAGFPAVDPNIYRCD